MLEIVSKLILSTEYLPRLFVTIDDNYSKTSFYTF